MIWGQCIYVNITKRDTIFLILKKCLFFCIFEWYDSVQIFAEDSQAEERTFLGNFMKQCIFFFSAQKGIGKLAGVD